MKRGHVASDILLLGGALLIGSIPVSNIISLAVTGQDLREIGSGTVSPAGLYRVGGVRPFAAACLLDLAKGSITAALVRHRHPALAAAAAGLAVTGHNWSLFQVGAGGRGVLPATGILLVAAPSGAALIGGGIAVGYVTGDTAPGCFAAQLLLVPVLAAVQGRRGVLLGLATAVPMLAKRLLGNSLRTRERRQTYLTRMIFDRDILSGGGGHGRGEYDGGFRGRAGG
ncbi:MAG: glycerol-3-phosphate acyltransferase [Streptosporangiaceae bacterium]